MTIYQPYGWERATGSDDCGITAHGCGGGCRVDTVEFTGKSRGLYTYRGIHSSAVRVQPSSLQSFNYYTDIRISLESSSSV